MCSQEADAAADELLSAWSKLTEFRSAITDRYNKVFRLPVFRKQWHAVRRELAPGLRVLEIGAGTRPFEAPMKRAFPGLTYESMDVDRSRPHDYYDLDEVRGPYDRILVMDVIEHLELRDGVRLLARARELLEPGGRIVVVVPNTFSPTTCLWDVTHVTHYSYAELGGILIGLGFGFPDLCRIHDASLGRRICRRLFRHVTKLLMIDPAQKIVAAAEKPA